MSIAIACCHYNPGSFAKPRAHFLEFIQRLRSEGIPYFVAELAYDSDAFVLPSAQNIIQLRTNRENVLWHKENLINLLVSRIPTEYEKIAWIDTDVVFDNPHWLVNADRALDRHGIVQLFDQASWTDRSGQVFKTMPGSAYSGVLSLGKNHPGFAWAANRRLWTEAGGLCEYAVIGGGDSLMAAALLGGTIPDFMNYKGWENWTSRISSWVKANGGPSWIEGTAVHKWHGEREDRKYVDRHKILRNLIVEQCFSRREDGLMEFAGDCTETLRASFLLYFLGRREDGIES